MSFLYPAYVPLCLLLSLIHPLAATQLEQQRREAIKTNPSVYGHEAARFVAQRERLLRKLQRGAPPIPRAVQPLCEALSRDCLPWCEIAVFNTLVLAILHRAAALSKISRGESEPELALRRQVGVVLGEKSDLTNRAFTKGPNQTQAYDSHRISL